MTSIPFFLLFFAVATIYAAWRGGGPERVTAGAYALGLAASASFSFLRVPGAFRVVPVGLFIVDAILLVALCLIAIRANRWWVIPAAGCQLVAVMVHATKELDASMIPNSYAFLVTIWSWPMVALLVAGTWAHRRRLKAGIFIPDWKPSFAARRFRSRERRRRD